VRSMLFRALALACPLLMCAGALDQSPAQVQPPVQDDKGPGGNDRPADQQQKPPEKPPPSIVDLFKPHGIDRIAAYCADQPDSRPNDWLHSKFICEIRVTDVAIAWFSLLLALFTIGLVVVGLMQATIMRRTARRQLRAYVFVAEIEISELRPGTVPDIAVTIKNFGQTPAFRLTQWAKAGLDTYPQPTAVPNPVPHTEFPARPLGPTDTYIVRLAPMPNPINEAAIRALLAREAAIYIAGEVRYRDAFNKRRRTRYLLFLNADSGMRDFAGHKDGNEAT
jgi:hypothetical protein